MDVRKLLLGTLVGGIALFLLGWLIYGFLLASFMESSTTEAAAALMKETPDWIWLIIGTLLTALFITYIFLKWAGISTFGSGAQAGFIMGLILFLGMNAMWYSMAEMSTLSWHVVDAIASAVMWAIAGGVIGVVLGTGSSNA